VGKPMCQNIAAVDVDQNSYSNNILMWRKEDLNAFVVAKAIVDKEVSGEHRNPTCFPVTPFTRVHDTGIRRNLQATARSGHAGTRLQGSCFITRSSVTRDGRADGDNYFATFDFEGVTHLS